MSTNIAPFALSLSTSALALVQDVREQIAEGKTRAEFAASYARAGDTFFIFALIQIAESGLLDYEDEKSDTYKAARKTWCEGWSTDSKNSIRAYVTECLSLVRKVRALNLPAMEIASLRDLRTIGRMKPAVDVVSTIESPEHEEAVANEREAVRQAVEAEQARKQAEEAARQQAEGKALAEAEAGRQRIRAEKAEGEAARIRETYATSEETARNAIEALQAEVDNLRKANAALQAEVDSLKATGKGRKAGNGK